MLAEHDAKMIYDDKLPPKKQTSCYLLWPDLWVASRTFKYLHPGDVREKAMPKVFLGGSGVNSMQW